MRTNSIPITHGLTCPCCHQPTRRQWHQPSWNPDKPPLDQTDCTNPECAGYFMTVSVAAFFERYAKKELK